MLGSDLFSHASVGHYMAQFAQHTAQEAHTSIENDQVQTSVNAQNAPGAAQDYHRPVESSAKGQDLDFGKQPKDPTQEVGPDGKAYTPEEEKEIEELEDRDAEVKRHEQAHFQAGGKYASTPKYEYQTGPDGKRYAVGGSVDIDMSEVPDDPQATLEKARVIKRAALAPEDPSVQDRKVAREADQMAARAQRQLSDSASNYGEHEVHGAAAAHEKEQAKTLEDITAGVTTVSTESLEIDPSEHFVNDNVLRFRTSRLQMAGQSTQTLASPVEHNFFRGQGRSFDHYG
ncbi:MAG: putative metalloprotease CJM1_0395 family protein [Bacteroidota bacterium]